MKKEKKISKLIMKIQMATLMVAVAARMTRRRRRAVKKMNWTILQQRLEKQVLLAAANANVRYPMRNLMHRL